MNLGIVRSLHRFPVKSMGGETLESVEVTERGVTGDRIYALRDEVVGEIRGAKNWPPLLRCRAWFDGERVRIALPDGTELGPEDPQLAPALSALVGTRVRVCPLEPAENRDHYRRRIPGARLAAMVGRSKRAARALQRMAAIAGLDGEVRRQFGREEDEPLPDLTAFSAELAEFVSPPGTYFDAFPLHLLTTASVEAGRAAHPSGDWDVRRFRPNILIATEPDASGLVEEAWAERTLKIGDVVVRCTLPTPRCSMVLQQQGDLSRDPQILRTIVRAANQCLGIYASVEKSGRIRTGDAITLV